MVPHHDRKDHRPPTRTIQIPAQRPRLTQRPRLRKHMPRQRSLRKPPLQRPIQPTHRQTRLPIRKPRLPHRILQQPHRSPRSHQVMPTQPRPVIKHKVILINPRMFQKRTHQSRTSDRRPITTESSLSQMMKPQLCVQILADFIGNRHIFQHCCGTMRSQKFIWDYLRHPGTRSTLHSATHHSMLLTRAPRLRRETHAYPSATDAPPAPPLSPQSPAPPASPSKPPPHTPPDHESQPPTHPAANSPQSTHTPAAPSTPAPDRSAHDPHSSPRPSPDPTASTT